MFLVICIQLMLNLLVCNFLVPRVFLNSGIMFASSHSERTIPSSSDKLYEDTRINRT